VVLVVVRSKKAPPGLYGQQHCPMMDQLEVFSATASLYGGDKIVVASSQSQIPDLRSQISDLT
jgi:hypothetical protein